MAFNFPSQTSKNYLQTINPSAPDAGAALKVLSLNLPGFVGGNPIAPDALLRPGLGINAQVGGTIAAPPAPPPTAAPSPALAGLSAQLGSPDQPPGPAGGPPSSTVSPFTSAPIAALASNALGTNNFAPSAAPSNPVFEFGHPGDVYGGAPTAPSPAPAPSGSDALIQLLTTLFQPSGDAGANPTNQDTQLI